MTTIDPLADLDIEITNSAATFAPGDVKTFTATITNRGAVKYKGHLELYPTALATDIGTISDLDRTLAGSATAASAADTGVQIHDLLTLPVGGSATYVIEVTYGDPIPVIASSTLVANFRLTEASVFGDDTFTLVALDLDDSVKSRRTFAGPTATHVTAGLEDHVRFPVTDGKRDADLEQIIWNVFSVGDPAATALTMDMLECRAGEIASLYPLVVALAFLAANTAAVLTTDTAIDAGSVAAISAALTAFQGAVPLSSTVKD